MKFREIAFGAAVGLFAATSAFAQQAATPPNPAVTQGQQDEGATEASGLPRSAVEQVQQQLKQQGLYQQGKVDGIWGPETAQAVKSFQQAHSIEPTGQPDAQTLAALGVQPGAEQASGPSPNQGGGAQGMTAPPSAAQGAAPNMGSGQQPGSGTTPGGNGAAGQNGNASK